MERKSMSIWGARLPLTPTKQGLRGTTWASFLHASAHSKAPRLRLRAPLPQSRTLSSTTVHTLIFCVGTCRRTKRRSLPHKRNSAKVPKSPILNDGYHRQSVSLDTARADGVAAGVHRGAPVPLRSAEDAPLPRACHCGSSRVCLSRILRTYIPLRPLAASCIVDSWCSACCCVYNVIRSEER